MSLYHEGHRELQDRFDARRLADVVAAANLHDSVTALDAAFIAEREFFFLATADAQGRPNCSFKAGARGFVRVVDEKTVAFPCYDGNGMFLSMGNVLRNPEVGLLFIDFEKPNRLRLNGRASITDGDPLMREYAEAQFIVRVAVREVFLNCPRYIPRLARVAASPFVPVEGRETPFPNWKQIEGVRETLPDRDRERAAALPAISIEDYMRSIG